uniref:Uncharacterized protein n=1 Tax=Anguilla anguilla TaxID=7936 RepID=A0A0E9QHF2_ANGAN
MWSFYPDFIEFLSLPLFHPDYNEVLCMQSFSP